MINKTLKPQTRKSVLLRGKIYGLLHTQTQLSMYGGPDNSNSLMLELDIYKEMFLEKQIIDQIVTRW